MNDRVFTLSHWVIYYQSVYVKTNTVSYPDIIDHVDYQFGNIMNRQH